MKLAAHFNRASIVLSLALLVAGSVIYFVTINSIETIQLDHDLREQLDEVRAYVKNNQHLPNQSDLEDQVIFSKTSLKSFTTKYYDTTYYSRQEKEYEKGRAVSDIIIVNGQTFFVTITDSKKNTEHLLSIVTIITLLLSILLFLFLYITNRYLLDGLWRPFFATLKDMKEFSASGDKDIVIQNSKVDEFNELNAVARLMAIQVKKDYQNLKRFTENASHEMQTPLAIITSKLDMLIQDETITHQQYRQIGDIYVATSKLGKLNQLLLLLVKLENNLIPIPEQLDLEYLILDKINQFQEQASLKKLQVDKHTEPIFVQASKFLVDILINNLLSNAIRHSTTHGRILITLSGNTLTLQNTGAVGPLDQATIFERFQKGSGSEGAGLGLNIAKSICGIYHWTLQYEYVGQFHTFRIHLNNTAS